MKVKEESEKVGLKFNIQKTKIMASGPITSWQIDGETVETVRNFIFWVPKSQQIVTATMKLKDASSLEGKLWPISNSHAWMWKLDYKESWVLKNGCFWTVVLEKILESPLDSKEIQLVHPKEDQSWVFIGRNDVEAKIPILWPSEVKNWLIWKDPDVGKDWRQEEKGMTEDKMVGWNHWLNGHEFEYIPRAGDGQGGLVCCSPWRCKDLDVTEWLNWTEWRQMAGLRYTEAKSYQLIDK